jgi:hypothetical protein
VASNPAFAIGGFDHDLRHRHPSKIIVRYTIIRLIIDAAELYALAGSLFYYARQSDDGSVHPNVSVEAVLNALRSNEISDEEHEDLFKIVMGKAQIVDESE